jgi:pilus assembly protein CpaF
MKENSHELISELFGRPESVASTVVMPSASALSPAMLSVLSDAQREVVLRSKSNSNAALPVENDIREVVKVSGERSGYLLNSYELDQLTARISSSRSFLGILSPLQQDLNISDIVVRGYNKIEYQRGRKNYRTAITYANQQDYEAFVERLLSSGNKSCSVKVPIVDLMLDPYTRVNVVHQSIAQGGPFVTIRFNRFEDVSIDTLIDSGLAPRFVIEYLSLAVKAGLTVLIAGEVGTGKTTLGRALASNIKQDESILVIEDTPEIKIAHPHVRHLVSRTDNSEGVGKVGPADCIRAGMRMAMSRIIFGEIRDSEAAEAFVDVCSSGHAGLSTIHARTAEDAVTRLELFLGRAQRGVSTEIFQQQISSAVQIVVHLNFCRITGKRRVMQVKELGRVIDGRIKQTPIFSYYHLNQPRWRLDHRLSNFRDKFSELDTDFSFSSCPDELNLVEAGVSDASCAWR